MSKSYSRMKVFYKKQFRIIKSERKISFFSLTIFKRALVISSQIIFQRVIKTKWFRERSRGLNRSGLIFKVKRWCSSTSTKIIKWLREEFCRSQFEDGWEGEGLPNSQEEWNDYVGRPDVISLKMTVRRERSLLTHKKNKITTGKCRRYQL